MFSVAFEDYNSVQAVLIALPGDIQPTDGWEKFVLEFVLCWGLFLLIFAYNKWRLMLSQRPVLKGGMTAVTFPRQALTYSDGCFKPSISRETKPELICEIALPLPPFINSDWVKEVTIRPNLGQFWIDWVIDDGKESVTHNPNLDYSQAWGYDHGGGNWLTGVSSQGKSLIIEGKRWRSMNQGYCRLVAKYKQGKGRGSLTLPQRYDVITCLTKSYRKNCGSSALLDPVATSIRIPRLLSEGDVKYNQDYLS